MWVRVPLDQVVVDIRSLMVEHVAVNHAGAGSNPVEPFFLFMTHV